MNTGLNGVWSIEAALDVAVVAELVDHVASVGVPYCMQLRPGWPEGIEEMAGARGLRRVEGEPVMVLDDDRHLDPAQDVHGLAIRRLAPEEGSVHAAVVASGFGEPETPFWQLMTPDVLRIGNMRCYVGEVDGRPVTTCTGVTVGHCVAIFSVATLPTDRQRGYGAAVTGRAVRDGLAAGAEWAWLSSSKAGFGVYSRLGFRTVERWDFWESPI